jgi:hypothetical protein
VIARTFSSRSIGQDCAANRRAPVIDWLKIVRGAWNGVVACNRLFNPTGVNPARSASTRPAPPAACAAPAMVRPGTRPTAASNSAAVGIPPVSTDRAGSALGSA